MAATSYVWYYDYRTASKQRRRLEVVCAHASTLARTLPPAWGDDPAPGSTYRRIPDGAISIPEPKEPQAAFEKWTIGMAATAVYEIEVDFAALARDADGGDDAELVSLAWHLRNYRAIGAGSFAAGTATVTHDTSNVWTLHSDEGDAAAAIGAFVVRFQGAQRAPSEKDGTLIYGRTFRQRYTLFAVYQAVAEAVPMSHVGRYMYESEQASAPTHDFIYDTYWIDGSEKYRWAFNAEDSGTEAEFFQLYDLFAYTRLTVQAYKAFLRTSTVPTIDHASAVDDETGHPFDHWTFYRQGGTRTLAPGTALTRTEVYVMGAIQFDGVARGGLLIADESDDTLARTDLSVWEFLSQACTAAVCKGRVEQTGYDTITVRFMAPKETVATTDVTVGDLIRGVGDDGRMRPLEVPIVEGFGMVGTVAAEIRKARGDDRSSYTYKSAGSLSDDGGNIPLLFDTLPTVAEEGDWTWALSTGGFFSGYTLRLNLGTWKLYYFDDPFSEGTNRPIKCSHACGFDDGTGNVTGSSDVAMPVDGYDDTDDESREAWRDDVRIQLGTAQRDEYTTPMLAARMSAALFGQAKQTRYTVTLPTSIIGIHDIGECFRLAPDAGGNYTAQALAGTDDVDLTDLPGICYALSIRIDDATDRAEVELLGLDS